jgi:dTMP kinase
VTSRGRFIVLEGADGVGTTTQMHAVAARLRARGRNVHETAEPSTGPVGTFIRQRLKAVPTSSSDDIALKRELALLFAADRLHHYASEVAPKLAAGVDVVSDRYVLSSLVYQSVDLPLDDVARLNQWAQKADATLLVTLAVDVAMQRLSARAERDLFETRVVQERVHKRYAELASRVDAYVVDGSGAIDVVTDRILRALDGAHLW